MSALKIGFKPYALISAGVNLRGSGTSSLEITFDQIKKSGTFSHRNILHELYAYIFANQY